jgi:galactokinase
MSAPCRSGRSRLRRRRPGSPCWSSTPGRGTSSPTAATPIAAPHANEPRPRSACPPSATCPFESLDRELARLDPVLARRARHVVSENQRVLRVIDLLAADQVRAIGPLLTASHASLRDDFEVSCAELDLGVETALATGALGARMVGGGFGGSLLALVPGERASAIEAAVAAAFHAAGFAAPSCFAAVPADGARRL